MGLRFVRSLDFFGRLGNDIERMQSLLEFLLQQPINQSAASKQMFTRDECRA